MQRFVIKSVFFIALSVFFVSALILISDFCLKQKKEKLLRLDDDIKIVFAGDSNVEFSVNDSLINNSVNIAQSGEAYLYSYIKIRSLLEYNKNINTVLLGFSFHEILKDKEELLLFQDSYIIEKIKAYNYLLNKSEKALIFGNNKTAYLQGLLQTVFNNFMVCSKILASKGTGNRIINFGGYQYSVRDKLEEDIKLQDNSGTDTLSLQHPEKGILQERYLMMISELCRQKSVRLILLNTPKHDYYSYKINQEIKNNWVSARNSMPRDSLYDFSSFPLPDSCYGDITHLNYKGAGIFSTFLNNKLHPE